MPTSPLTALKSSHLKKCTSVTTVTHLDLLVARSWQEEYKKQWNVTGAFCGGHIHALCKCVQGHVSHMVGISLVSHKLLCSEASTTVVACCLSLFSARATCICRIWLADWLGIMGSTGPTKKRTWSEKSADQNGKNAYNGYLFRPFLRKPKGVLAECPQCWCETPLLHCLPEFPTSLAQNFLNCKSGNGFGALLLNFCNSPAVKKGL